MSATLKSRDGDRANLDVSMTLFGEKISVPVSMYLVEGRWLNSTEYAARVARIGVGRDTAGAAEAAAD